MSAIPALAELTAEKIAELRALRDAYVAAERNLLHAIETCNEPDAPASLRAERRWFMAITQEAPALLSAAEASAAAVAECERLARINSELCRTHNEQNLHGARQDERLAAAEQARAAAEGRAALLAGVLEDYACPIDCPEKRLKDGTCIRVATDGTCGEPARTALASSGGRTGCPNGARRD